MSSFWGKNVRISIFGESHSKAVGVTIEGLPAGFEINLSEIKHQLFRRSSFNETISTPRKEPDEFEIISGFFNNKTTGTPICAIFKNKNINSEDYEKNLYKPRPGTADYTNWVKYKYNNDFRGGGHSSARLTVGLVFAGNIAYQVLKKRYGIVIGSHICSLYNKKSELFNKSNISKGLLHKLSLEYFPVIDQKDKKEYINILQKFRKLGDTVGGEIEVGVVGVPVGVGSPIFNNLESKLASLVFSVPAVKSLDFGFGITRMTGSSANDEFFYDEEYNVSTKENNHCGILGGISSGQDIVFKIGFKPIPSINKIQRTVNLKNKKNTTIKINGRHDVSAVVRAAPIIEGISALAILELLLS